METRSAFQAGESHKFGTSCQGDLCKPLAAALTLGALSQADMKTGLLHIKPGQQGDAHCPHSLSSCQLRKGYYRTVPALRQYCVSRMVTHATFGSRYASQGNGYSGLREIA